MLCDIPTVSYQFICDTTFVCLRPCDIPPVSYQFIRDATFSFLPLSLRHPTSVFSLTRLFAIQNLLLFFSRIQNARHPTSVLHKTDFSFFLLIFEFTLSGLIEFEINWINSPAGTPVHSTYIRTRANKLTNKLATFIWITTMRPSSGRIQAIM